MRTVELAQKSKKFGSRQLRAALDSSPLWGAAKVEDTYNLLGHALKKALGVIACQQGSNDSIFIGNPFSNNYVSSQLSYRYRRVPYKNKYIFRGGS